MIYNKLVRDRIPAIIESNGQIPRVRIRSDEEYTVALEQKLDEEVREYHREVVYALTENLGCSKEELMEVYQKKHDKRGGFRNRVYLISNEG